MEVIPAVGPGSPHKFIMLLLHVRTDQDSHELLTIHTRFQVGS